MVYIDDISIAAPKGQGEQIRWFKEQFGKRFKIKDLGEIRKILGIEVQRDRPNQILRIS